MKIPIFQIDAFSDRVFGGNPAAVCPLEFWLEDEILQRVAMENNLSETAFLVRRGDGDYDLRWFTPTVEVKLCGHATLASGAYLLEKVHPEAARVTFHSKSGALGVGRDGARFTLDFPAYPTQEWGGPDIAYLMGGMQPETVLYSPAESESGRLIAVYPRERDVLAIRPDFAEMLGYGDVSVCVTAPGDEVDFVSRYFAPNHGVDEDPVTGSNHSLLTPYWARRLGRSALTARQLSRRGGSLWCRDLGERVEIAGHVAWYLEGSIRW